MDLYCSIIEANGKTPFLRGKDQIAYTKWKNYVQYKIEIRNSVVQLSLKVDSVSTPSTEISQKKRNNFNMLSILFIILLSNLMGFTYQQSL